ncbi:MAG: 4-hydroxy-tetrahydrodipicolinate synthase [Bacteroidetes bacterium]|nr:4-hydroxy-tetrahydrodipicolinate synthase [Bacteroidota bacterium]
MKKLTGTGVALVTPFHADGTIDFNSLKKILAHTAKGVDYYVVMGTTGESATMTKDEKKEVLQFVLKNNPKKLPVVYGIGGNNTDAVIEEIHHTNLRGVTALLSVGPYYNKPSQEGIYQHFKKVADTSTLPILLYNVPGRTASNISADTTLRLAQHKNIVGVKEASGNLEQCMKIAKEKPKSFLLISGDDLLTVPIYAVGGVGVISVLANAFPEAFKKITSNAASGNYTKASAETFTLLEINGPMYEEGNPTGVKYLLSLMNVCKPHVRLPLVEPSAGLRKKIEKVFEKMK